MPEIYYIYELDNHCTRPANRPEVCPRFPHLRLGSSRRPEWRKTTLLISSSASAAHQYRQYHSRSLVVSLSRIRRSKVSACRLYLIPIPPYLVQGPEFRSRPAIYLLGSVRGHHPPHRLVTLGFESIYTRQKQDFGFPLPGYLVPKWKAKKTPAVYGALARKTPSSNCFSGSKLS